MTNRLSQILNAYDRHGLVGLGLQVSERPHRLVELLRGSTSHFYSLENPFYWEDVVTIIPPVVNQTRDKVVAVWEEICDNARFERALTEQLEQTIDRPAPLYSNWRELLYILVRLQKPSHVIETGVYDGLSAAYILAALHENQQGQLTSIDINDTSRLPSDIDGAEAGWIVPQYLRERWTLRFGDSRELLPPAVERHPPDLFLHDSLHTAEHMRFEFETAMEVMEPGDMIVTDNCRFNNVFRSLAETEFATVSFWQNTEYALSPSNDRVNDRLGIGVLE